MEKMTDNEGMNGIGDVEAVSNVLASIVKSGNISEAVTQSVLNIVSNLLKSDFKTADNDDETQLASKISDGYIVFIGFCENCTILQSLLTFIHYLIINLYNIHNVLYIDLTAQFGNADC